RRPAAAPPDGRGGARARARSGRRARQGERVKAGAGAKLRVCVGGASGRMGQAVARLAAEHGAEVCAEVSEGEGFDAIARARPDVAVDFSAPGAVAPLAAACAAAGCALVSGTTGLAPDAQAALDLASAKIAVLWEPNMSVGVSVLGDLVRRAIDLLGPGEPIELTHRASSRDLFARGALRAAAWIAGKPPGRYTLAQVLGA